MKHGATKRKANALPFFLPLAIGIKHGALTPIKCSASCYRAVPLLSFREHHILHGDMEGSCQKASYLVQPFDAQSWT